MDQPGGSLSRIGDMDVTRPLSAAVLPCDVFGWSAFSSSSSLVVAEDVSAGDTQADEEGGG